MVESVECLPMPSSRHGNFIFDPYFYLIYVNFRHSLHSCQFMVPITMATSQSGSSNTNSRILGWPSNYCHVLALVVFCFAAVIRLYQTLCNQSTAMDSGVCIWCLRLRLSGDQADQEHGCHWIKCLKNYDTAILCARTIFRRFLRSLINTLQSDIIHV